LALAVGLHWLCPVTLAIPFPRKSKDLSVWSSVTLQSAGDARTARIIALPWKPNVSVRMKWTPSVERYVFPCDGVSSNAKGKTPGGCVILPPTTMLLPDGSVIGVGNW